MGHHGLILVIWVGFVFGAWSASTVSAGLVPEPKPVLTKDNDNLSITSPLTTMSAQTAVTRPTASHGKGSNWPVSALKNVGTTGETFAQATVESKPRLSNMATTTKPIDENEIDYSSPFHIGTAHDVPAIPKAVNKTGHTSQLELVSSPTLLSSRVSVSQKEFDVANGTIPIEQKAATQQETVPKPTVPKVEVKTESQNQITYHGSIKHLDLHQEMTSKRIARIASRVNTALETGVMVVKRTVSRVVSFAGQTSLNLAKQVEMGAKAIFGSLHIF
ncbi:unnamed protein product [Orchesella dallaii]|uniref:Uncharacterized protein n=1 Tax=Orchesella dallaii TaxID=48710 RepID=A0ABP1PN94_9HEXA